MLYTFENLIYPKNIHLHTNVLQVFALNSYLSASWLKSCFLQLKRSSIQRIYTFVRVFFHFFFIRLSTSVRVDYNGISTLDNVFYPKNVQLCASWLKWHILHWKILSTWGINTSERLIFQLKNYPCVSLLKRCFLHLELFSTRRICIFCVIGLN